VEKEDAQMMADRLLELILQHQPLFVPLTGKTAMGEGIGEAVVAIRQALIEGLAKQP